METIIRIPRVVFILGIVSLFMDVSSEMIVPLMPLFLSDVLNASKVSIGLIEGIAESTASILKVVSGWFSDRIKKRKPLILWGYSLSVFSRPLIAEASSWIGVLVYRFIDRTGKGIRTSPRDALIADTTESKLIGRAFGFHRAMDTIGAVIGPAIAFGLLSLTSNNMRLVFWISIIPGLFAIATIAIFVKDVVIPTTSKNKDRHLEPDNGNFRQGSPSSGNSKSFPSVSFASERYLTKTIDRKFKLFLSIVALFTIGKIPEAFLILRAKEIGVDTLWIPILYLVFNITSAVLSTPLGILADNLGKGRLILLSYITGGLVFVGFALSTKPVHAWLLFPLYGLFIAMNEGNQRALVSSLVEPEKKGTGYGIYHTAAGLSALPGGLISGYIYQLKGSFYVFLYGASLSIISAMLFFALLSRTRKAVQG